MKLGREMIGAISSRSMFLIPFMAGLLLFWVGVSPSPLTAQERDAGDRVLTNDPEEAPVRENGPAVEGAEERPATHADLFYEKGMEALKQGDFSEAERLFSSLLSIAIDDPRGYLGLGEVYYAQKRYASAERYFLEVLNMDGKNVRALLNMGRIRMALLQEDEAFEFFQEVIEIDENNSLARRFLDNLVKEGTVAGDELPREYYAILVTPSITREELAALIYFRTDKLGGMKGEEKPKIVTDISESWAKEYILEVTTNGIMDVYPNYTFLPKATVERGELAQVLTRLIAALGYRLVPRGTGVQFSDVLPTNRFYNAIVFVGQLGLMSSFPDNTFRPSEVVSGEEAIAALDRLRDLVYGAPRPG